MIERQVRFNLGLSRRGPCCSFALCLLVFCTPRLGSENVAVTTSYPAPSGVYREMISTGDTFLTRDGGKLVIGGASPAAGSAATDVTLRGGLFFGASGAYKLTNLGQPTLADSTVGDLTKNAAAFHLGTAAGAAGAPSDAFVFWSGPPGTGVRTASIRHDKSVRAGAFIPTGSPDLAEYAMAEADVEAADVVSVSETALSEPGPGAERFQLRKSRAPYETALLGVIADGGSGFQIQSHMGDSDTAHPGKPLVLIGRVPVKVTGENGAIRTGDSLTSSSKRGFAMKATAPGPTIGMALENFDGAEGTVLCAVRAGEQGGGEALRRLQDDNLSLLKRIEALEKRRSHD